MAGSVTINGACTQLSPDQAEQALLLSHALNVSERYAASLLLVARNERGRWGQGAVRTACLLYHREKLALLNVLKVLLAALVDARSQDNLLLPDVIEPILRDIVTTEVTLSTATTRLVPSLLALLESIGAQEARLDSKGQLPEGLRDELITHHTTEAQEAAHILVLLAFTNCLSRVDMLALISWLQGIPPIHSDHATAVKIGAYAIFVLTAVLAAFEQPGTWIQEKETVDEITAELSSKQTWQTPLISSALSLQWVLTLAQRMPAAPSAEANSKIGKLQSLATDSIQSGVFAFLERGVISIRHPPARRGQPESLQLDIDFRGQILNQIERLVLGVTEVMLPLLKLTKRVSGNSNEADPIEQLLSLIKALCTGRPDSGLPFWIDAGGRINRFLLWTIDSRDVQDQLSLLEMLAALSSGPRSAIQAHNLLANFDVGNNRMLSWSVLFARVQNTIELYQKPGAPPEMPEIEVDQLVAFLRLLHNVVYHSQVARTAIYERSDFQNIKATFYIAPSGKVKAALYAVLAAFARRDNPGADMITSDIWTLLSTTDVLGTDKSALSATDERFRASSGAMYELECVEGVCGLYPATTALIDLLTVVIPYVPEGTDAYVDFVVRHVYLKADQRAYRDDSEQYQIEVACLGFISRCLSQFKPEPVSLSLGITSSPELMPGFLITRDILVNGPLCQKLFAEVGVEDEELSWSRPAPTRKLKLAMQCLARVFEIQDMFLQDLLPSLTQAGYDGARLGPVEKFAPLDQHMLFSHEAVVDIALHVNSLSLNVAMLSIQLMDHLASSTSFSVRDQFSLPSGRKKLNRLAGLLEMTGETENVRAGFIKRLMTADEGDAAEEEWGEEHDFLPDRPDIRIVILEFFIKHVSVDAPNVSHLMLGYDVSASTVEAPPLPDPSASTTSETVLSVIMSLIDLNHGTLHALLDKDPVLAERCFQLLLHLCADPYSSVATLRYLRDHGNFMVQTLVAVPFRPSTDLKGTGKMLSVDGSRQTSVEAVVANMRIKASLLDILALQFHLVTNFSETHLADPLVDLLMSERAGDVPLIESLLDSFKFVWADDRDVLRAQMTVLATLNDDLARGVGDEEFDLDKAQETIEMARKELQINAGLNDQVSRDAFDADATRWIKWMTAQNAHGRIRAARALALRNWRHALGMVLSRCSAWFSTQARNEMLFSLLVTLLPLLRTESDSASLTTITSAVLELLAAVRLICQEQGSRYTAPSPDLVLGTLCSLLSAILQPSLTAPARGNLYSALINLLQFVQQEDAGAGTDDWDVPDDVSLAGTSMSVPPAGASTLLCVRAALNDQAREVVARLAEDALAASDIWKAVSYTLLDKLTEFEGPRWMRSSRGLDVLLKQGYLKRMVSALRDSDLALQDCLRPDPASLNALYVYQAQMSFFVRLATSRQGVEALLDLSLINILAQADFIAASPDVGAGLTDMEGFLPAARERYAELLTPALEVATTMFSLSPVANDPISALLANQGESLSELLQGLLGNAVAIGQIEQAHLLVVLISLRAAKIHHPLPSHAPNYHHQLLSVAAGFLARPGWVRRVLPTNETEREQVLHADCDGQTRFDRRAQQATERLQRALLGYLETVSRPSPSVGRTTAPIRPVLTSATSTFAPSMSVGSLQRGTALPSLGTGVQALEEEFDKLSAHVGLLDKVAAAAAHPAQLRGREVKELLGSAEHVESTPQLSRLLLQRERTLKGLVGTSLSVIELLLVLLVRHFDFYVGLAEVDTQGSQSSLPPGTPGARADKTLLVQYGLEKAAVLADRAMDVALYQDQVPGALERCGFIEMLLRKLQATLLGARGSGAEAGTAAA